MNACGDIGKLLQLKEELLLLLLLLNKKKINIKRIPFSALFLPHQRLHLMFPLAREHFPMVFFVQ